MTFQEFYNKYRGVANVGNTTANKRQCVGLSSLWMDNFNIPHVYGHAKDLFVNAPDEHFEKIINTPEAIPQKGDIIVWGQGYNGTYGHTGIATGTGDTKTFECFEQNDPIGSSPHNKTYNYAYIIGWLRSKKAVTNDVSVPKDTFEELVRKADQYDEICTFFKFDNKDNNGSKIKEQFEQLRRTATEKEAELKTTRIEREQALSKVCPDPGSHNSNNNSGGPAKLSDSSVVPVNPSTDNSSEVTPINLAEIQNAFASFIKWFKNIFK